MDQQGKAALMMQAPSAVLLRRQITLAVLCHRASVAVGLGWMSRAPAPATCAQGTSAAPVGPTAIGRLSRARRRLPAGTSARPALVPAHGGARPTTPWEAVDRLRKTLGVQKGIALAVPSRRASVAVGLGRM